jgi:hypothetical protein
MNFKRDDYEFLKLAVTTSIATALMCGLMYYIISTKL